jgi:hypothetical protein
VEQQAEIIAYGSMIFYFPCSGPEYVDLPLAKCLACRRNPLKFPGMPPSHGGLHNHHFIFLSRFQVFESQIGKCRPQPRARREKAPRSSPISTFIVRLILRFPIDEIIGDDLVSQLRIAGLDKPKRGEYQLFVALQAHLRLPLSDSIVPG